MCTLACDGVSKSNGLNQCELFSYMVGFSLYHFVTCFVIAIWVPTLGWLEQVEDFIPEKATNFNEIIVKKKT
jgi:hypothetical protein